MHGLFSCISAEERSAARLVAAGLGNRLRAVFLLGGRTEILRGHGAGERLDRNVVNGKTVHANYPERDSERGEATVKYSSELTQSMRDALEAVMATVPADQSVFGLKSAVAQCILQAAAHGQTSFDGLVASASAQLQTIISMLS